MICAKCGKKITGGYATIEKRGRLCPIHDPECKAEKMPKSLAAAKRKWQWME